MSHIPNSSIARVSRWRDYTRRLAAGTAAAAALLASPGCQGPAPERAPPPAAPPVTAPPAPMRAVFERAPWSEVQGWQADAVHEAWPALLASCATGQGRRPEWSAVCRQAQAAGPRIAPAAARQFLERHLEPHRIRQEDGEKKGDTGMVTGYYEPVLRGARTATGRYGVPLYGVPDDLLVVDLGGLYPELKGQRVRGRLDGRKVVPYYSRAELAASPRLAGKEIAWVEDPVEAFFLQVQGSGRVQLPSGETIRLAYADQNGHPYRSIGRYLVERGEMKLEEASAPRIRAWMQAHPERQQEVLNVNPSVVFFREEPLPDPNVGPKGSQGVPLTPGRSVAVDARFIPLGTPLFLATTQPLSSTPLERLVLAQDTGGAIRGPLRVDYFWGWGPEAGDAAGRMRQAGRLWLLWPKGQPLPRQE